MSFAELEKKAIERLKAFEPADGYYLAYSGGKDSDCIKILAQLAGVKFEAVHNLTTVDAPETVRYIKSQPDVRIDYPHISMWGLIVKKKFPPTRLARYCCQELKEKGGQGKVIITGVRWAESTNRKNNSGVVSIIGKPKGTQKIAEELEAEYLITPKGGLILNDDNDTSRRMVEQCYRTRKTIVNPIIDWSDEDVWEFLKHYGCNSNPLYCDGKTRVGCIGCPMQSIKSRKEEFERYPKYKLNYIKAFERMLKTYDKTTNWQSGQDVFDWWMSK